MAHFKRGKCRYQSSAHGYARQTHRRARLGLKPVRLPLYWWEDYPAGSHARAEIWPSWLNNYLARSPSWHNILYNNRPHRRATKRLERATISCAIDPEDTCWPHARRPHKYYW